MLTGKELGAAIRAAIDKKGVTQKAVAAHFNIKPPSIQDWINKGTIDKGKLPDLWEYFGDVVGPEHWGMKGSPASKPTMKTAKAVVTRLDDWSIHASPRSREVIDQLRLMAQKNVLGDEDWEMIRQLAQRFQQAKK